MRPNKIKIIKNIKIHDNYSYLLNNIFTNIIGTMVRKRIALKVEVMNLGAESVVVPPLSASSTIISALSEKGWSYQSVAIDGLIDVLKGQEVTFIYRDDVARLKSFYVKKILNANTLSKVLYLASLPGYSRVKSKQGFFDLLNRDFILKCIRPVDKHLILNDHIMDLLPHNFRIENYKNFLVKINASAVSVNSSKNMSNKQTFSTNDDKILRNILSTYHKNQKIENIIVVVSSRKSGSSYLYNYLKNSLVNVPEKIKELNFFSKNFHKGMCWYRSKFTIKTNHTTFVDVCPTYGHDEVALRRINKYCTECKIVILYRDPQDRCISHCKHILNNRRVVSFTDLLKNYPEVLNDSNYQKIFQNVVEAGFSDEQIIFIDFDRLVNCDQDFREKLSNLVNHELLPPRRDLAKNETYRVKFKEFYFWARKINRLLNILGFKLEQRNQDKIKKFFMTPKNEEWDLDLSMYSDFFEKQRSFISEIKRSNGRL